MDKKKLQATIEKIGELPTLPSVLGQILDTASDPDSSALDLGRFIAADQSLSAVILKLVNSAYYGFYRGVNSVPRAIVLLGFQEVRKLVLTATAFRSLSRGTKGADRVQLWRHSLAAAIAAEHCDKLLKTKIGADAFTAGLLHDVGKVSLELIDPEHYQRSVEDALRTQRFVRESELDIFGLDHAEVGGILAEHWKLPLTLVEAIRRHHAPLADDKTSHLTHLVGLADYITYQAGLGESSNGREPDQPVLAIQILGATQEQIDDVAKHLEASKDTVNDLLGVLQD